MSGPKGYARQDDYAEHRCECGHIFYKTDELGGECRFCTCTDHRPPGGGDSA